MWRLNCIGNLNRKMHLLVFCLTGGTRIIMIVPVISGWVFTVRDRIYIGKIRTSFPGSCVRYGIFRVLADRFISAVFHFIEMHMGGTIRYAKISIIILP